MAEHGIVRVKLRRGLEVVEGRAEGTDLQKIGDKPAGFFVLRHNYIFLKKWIRDIFTELYESHS